MKNIRSLWIVSLAVLFAGAASAREQDKTPRRAAPDAKTRASGVKWKSGVTSLSKLTDEEFRSRLLTPEDLAESVRQARSMPKLPLSADAAPGPAFDWREKGIETPIRDQGHCGSCWAFSMAGAEELQLLIKKPDVYGQPGAEVTRSPQALVSCNTSMRGCKGGTLNANYLVKTGLPAESSYPYHSGGGETKACDEEGTADADWRSDTEKISDWGSVDAAVADMKKALSKYGPIPSSMMVFDDFKDYKSGVYTKTDGAEYLGGHAILVVGYDDGEQSFTVKNSWSTGWGDEGYFKIAYSEVQCSLWDVLFGHKHVNFGCAAIAYNMKDGKSKPVLDEAAAAKALHLLSNPLP